MSPGRSAMHCGNRHRLLAERAHVERDLAGALRALHAIVVQAREHHVAQAHLQILRIEMRMPGAHRFAVVVEHAHELHRERFDVARARADLGARHRPGGRQMDVAEIGFLARAVPADSADAGGISCSSR